MKSFKTALAALALSYPVVRAADCDNTATELDFFNSFLTMNTLHESGGELKYENIGTQGDTNVDLVVTVAPGTSYTTSVPEKNGLHGQFGQINIMNQNTAAMNGEGTFDFCLVDHSNPSKKVTVDSFHFTFFDLDKRKGRNGLKEKILIDHSQFTSYSLDPFTQIKVECENGGGTPPECGSNERMVFQGPQVGSGDDNPTDPNTLTNLQKQRSVSFTFRQTSCFQVTFDHYCPLVSNRCKWTGGNFMFAGTAKQMVDGGECYQLVTMAPTKATTSNPTNAPTSSPIDTSTNSPTKATPEGPPRHPTSPPTDHHRQYFISDDGGSDGGGQSICGSSGGTDLDFFNSDLTVNTLHETGGQLRYENIGTRFEKSVDMIVTVADGTTYTTTEPYKNGINGAFGQISIMNKKTAELDGKGTFDFCLVDHDNPSQEITVEEFRFTFFDLDNRFDANGKTGLHESLVVDPSQFSSFVVDGDTEIEIECQDDIGTPPDCASNENLVFKGTQVGHGPLPDPDLNDNPDDPNNLTELQIQRSVSFVFTDTSCFQVTMDLFCPENDPTDCRNGVGNFLFAGTAKDLVDIECELSESPTMAPSASPSEMHSSSPTVAHSSSPTVAHSSGPTEAPSAPPSEAPSVPPSNAPSASPSHAPSDSPTEATEAPSGAPSEAPSSPPSRAPSAAPSSAPSATPTVAHSSAPSEPPSAAPSEAPSSPPSKAPSASPSHAPSDSPTEATEAPSNAPSESPSSPPSKAPSTAPSSAPSATPTVAHSSAPSEPPSAAPSEAPSFPPSEAPSSPPSKAPSASPSHAPSASPTEVSGAPSNAPSEAPSSPPSKAPSASPSVPPSNAPSEPPSVPPSEAPSSPPSRTPSASPSHAPSDSPTEATEAPSAGPSEAPSSPPSEAPSAPPSVPPSEAPSSPPSKAPSASPSHAPSDSPTEPPSNAPSEAPSSPPSKAPSASPSHAPSDSPTEPPSNAPSEAPSSPPSKSPSASPSHAPSDSPTEPPSHAPSEAPSPSPTENPTDIPTKAPTRLPTKLTPSPIEIAVTPHCSPFVEPELLESIGALCDLPHDAIKVIGSDGHTVQFAVYQLFERDDLLDMLSVEYRDSPLSSDCDTRENVSYAEGELYEAVCFDGHAEFSVYVSVGDGFDADECGKCAAPAEDSTNVHAFHFQIPCVPICHTEVPTQAPSRKVLTAPPHQDGNIPTFDLVFPTAGPTAGPTQAPTAMKRSEPPICTDDVLLLATIGGTEYPDVPINILEQNGNTVTFEIINPFDDTASIYTQFDQDKDDECMAETDVKPLSDAIIYTATCYDAVPLTIVDVYFTDSSAFNWKADHAEIPECCEAGDNPAVQYTFKLYCESQCGPMRGRFLPEDEMVAINENVQKTYLRSRKDSLF